MDRFIVILIIAAIIGIVYSYIVRKFTKSKLILFFPSIMGGIWIVYKLTIGKPAVVEGFQDLAIIITAMLIMAFIVGNVISVLIMKKR